MIFKLGLLLTHLLINCFNYNQKFKRIPEDPQLLQTSGILILIRIRL